jgi:DNA polymerase-3 subunit alpha
MENTEEKIKSNFVHLHVHSTYSLTDGIGLPEQYIDRCKELGQPALATTDHGSVSSHFKWYKKCKKAGITPILGCEMYIVKDVKELRERDYNHITVLVKNNIGYNNLMKLVTKAWTLQFYYKPRITFQDLFDHQEGLIVLSGCLSSPMMEILKMNSGFEMEQAEEMFDLFKSKIENFYVEFQAIGFPDGKYVYEKLIKLYNEKLKSKGFKCVATNDCHYVLEGQNKLQEILLCVQSKDTMDNPKHWKFDQDDFFLKSRKQMEDSLHACFPEQDWTEAIDETVRISESIDFTFPKAKPISFPMPEEEKVIFLKTMCYKGMARKGLFLKEGELALDPNKLKIYKDRLDHELDIIVQKNFVDYFLVVSDLIQWSKNNGILVGPARGSSAGSLACYALSITEVEPIKYGLIFERFIDLNREDLPDIDIDFEDDRRHEVKEYLEKKYGEDKVANLPTFAIFQGKSALDDIGRVFKIPFSVIDKIKGALIERSGGDSRASLTIEDTFNSTLFDYPKKAMEKFPELKYSMGLEGQIRQIGQHAAGVMISNDPITNFCAFYKMKDHKVISLEYKDASEIGLLKIDLLGLNTLSVVAKAGRMIAEKTGKKIDFYNMPLDDPKVYKAFCLGKLFGVFQFDGQAVNQVCRQIQPKDFDSLSAISALARPGPLNSGNTTEYIQRKMKHKDIKYVHPVMKSITSDSYGIVIYQEQVMRIMREIGDMSWKDTSEIRKLISRSQGVEKFNTFRDKFIPGALGHGLTQQEADKIWEEMCSYGSWSFNKSHSVSYSVISYWTQWLKVYHPMEFYGAILSLIKSDTKKRNIMKEFMKEGYKILPVDINKSKNSFTLEKEGLRIGLQDIKGFGKTVANKIIKKQPYRSYRDFASKVGSVEFVSKSTKTLIDLGAFDSLESQGERTLFGELDSGFKKEEMSFEEKVNLCPWGMEFGIEKNWLPIIKDNQDYFKVLPTNISDLDKTENGTEDVIICGIVYDKNLRDLREVSSSKGKKLDLDKAKIAKLISEKAKTRFGEGNYTSARAIGWNGRDLVKGEDYEIEEQFSFANFVVEDDYDFITVRLSQLKFPDYGKLIFEEIRADDVVVIKGRRGSGIRMFFANKIMSLRSYKESLLKTKKEV